MTPPHPSDRAAVGAEADLLAALTDDGTPPIERAALVLVVECAALIWLAQEPQSHAVLVLPRPDEETGAVALTKLGGDDRRRAHTLFAGAARALGWGGTHA